MEIFEALEYLARKHVRVSISNASGETGYCGGAIWNVFISKRQYADIEPFTFSASGDSLEQCIMDTLTGYRETLKKTYTQHLKDRNK
jgi:hypothetical protein